MSNKRNYRLSPKEFTRRFILISMFLAFSAQAYQCDYFYGDAKNMETLGFVAQSLQYASVEEFCASGDFRDLEINFMPNYFRYGEEDDDHYRLMLHKSYSSCTFIYNMTRKTMTDRSC